jgi:NTP pyrophosphatase (non-canonical NTP hydrolase)
MSYTLLQHHHEALAVSTHPWEPPLEYAALALAGEAGEFANMVKKNWRHWGEVDQGVTNRAAKAMVEELGDCLWYIVLAAERLGVTLEDVAQRNIDKLVARNEANRQADGMAE